MIDSTRMVSVVVPVYQSAGTLATLFQRLLAVEAELILKHSIALQMIFVDDGSTDTSRQCLQQLKKQRPDIVVALLTRNFGAVNASRTGFQFVTGDAFTIVAADLQDPPELLLDMVPRWLAGHKFVIAVRSSRSDPLVARFYSRCYYRLLRWLVVPGYPAGGFDVALMDRSMLATMRNCSKSTFTPLLAYWIGHTPSIVHYHRQERSHGRSGWSFSKKFKAFTDVMLGFSVKPIRLISGVGVLVSGASFAYGVSVAIGTLLGGAQVSGFATLAILITFLLGLIILMLGVIGEYLWRIFDEVNKRPESVIDEVI
jgi:polyisoprenyl-phosphate glycosyltransferase